jgi:hypothetical protein
MDAIDRKCKVFDLTSIPSVVNDYAAAINSLDTDSYANNFAANATVYEPVGNPAYEGHSNVRQFFEATGSLFASINFRWTFVHIVPLEIGRGVYQFILSPCVLNRLNQSDFHQGLELDTYNSHPADPTDLDRALHPIV